MYYLANRDVEVEYIRETFLMLQAQSVSKIDAAIQGDFLVNGKYLVEIGGKSKQQHQIAGAANGFIVKDDIEIGNDNIIPLWLFGFLY
nr:AAA family ATPase [Sunxiuqinia sp.]